MQPPPDSDDLGRLAYGVGNSCLMVGVFWLVVAIIAAVSCRSLSAEQPASTSYIQHLISRQNIGIAWRGGGEASNEALGAYFWYGCCNTCPPPHTERIAIIRPNWQWSSDCTGSYDGYMLWGNENEFAGSGYQAPAQMANWLTQQRASYPKAISVCLNSYDINYMLAVKNMLSTQVCDIWGIHTPAGLQDVSSHLDQFCANCRIWITEMYVFNDVTNAYGKAYNQAINTLTDPRVERYFLYTDKNAHVSSFNTVKADGSLYSSGSGFLDANQGYP